MRDSQRLWLVTGGAGFIGSNIAEELVRRGKRVRVLDNLSTGKPGHMAAFRDRVEFMRGDIRDFSDCRRAVKGADYVLHQAAIRSVPKSVDHPLETHESNSTGTLLMLTAAREAKVRRFVYASSSSVYGECTLFPQREDHLPRPVSPYAAQKLAGEHYAILFAKTYGLETVSLRYFNVFGPRQDPESQYSAVVPRFMEQAFRGEPLELHWDGRQSRDFTFVANVVQANILAALTHKGVGEAFNIANGRCYSLVDMLRVIESIVGRKIETSHTPKRAGDVRKTSADISKARRLLGYRPVVGFEEGLKLTWDYFVERYFRSKVAA
ncbi:MAG TPA: LPS biosynthesis protein WbpP [Elusimicrobia bacterium]|nr:LPS biosynthesis protein WbpP [Elusimicrobiota bacterium]HBT60694.1 LPS biosynthesis protein WbpP [Elusimicrobiota bacterium]